MPKNSDIDRLLRAAAQTPSTGVDEPPFGFVTRVVALARQNGRSLETHFFSQLFRRIAVAAALVVAVAAAGAYQELSESEELSEPLTNQYVMVDSALQTVFAR